MKVKKNKPSEEGGLQDPTSPEPPSDTPPVFSCPQEGCVRVFQRSAGLERHLSLGACSIAVEQQTLADVAKERYAILLKEDLGVLPSVSTTSVASISPSSIVPQRGWALKLQEKKHRFNAKQREYLTAKFNIGQDTGRKVRPEDVSRDMRHARGENGERLFCVTEFLSVEQIASFFSREAAKVRHQHAGANDDEIIAAAEETNFSSARNAVLATLGLKHPIAYDQYNVCELINNGVAAKLNVEMLQRISTELGLDVPERPVRRKAPYIKLLSDVVSQCSCRSKA